MAIFAIGDLHLSFSTDKPMCIFGENWKGHHEKIRQNWIENVRPHDTVLIPGDISWALRLEEARVDLDWIKSLPGKKIICKGNHDYWWTSTQKLRAAYPEFDFIFNTFSVAEGIAICGTRGWNCPKKSELERAESERSTELKDEIRIYNRELIRLRASLEAAKAQGYEDIITMLHYPPTNEKKERSGFVELMKEFGVSQMIYGHLHGEYSYDFSHRGYYEGIEYNLVSCDYTDFKLVKLRP